MMCKQQKSDENTEPFHFIFKAQARPKRLRIALFVISKVNMPPFVSEKKRFRPRKAKPKKEIVDSLSFALSFYSVIILLFSF